MERARTEAEQDLLDLAEWVTGMGAKEQRVRLEPIVNAVLTEAIREGYQLVYSAHDGVHVHTPSGVWIWLCPSSNGKHAHVDALITDERLETYLPGGDGE